MSKTFTFSPVGFDVFAPGRLAPPSGTVVRKTQPSGCPKNGTMGHCFIEDATSGEFYGLVLLNSLEAIK
jgi:hypothetical protein